jgi:hypothetical protein
MARNTQELFQIFLPEIEIAAGTILNGSFNSKKESFNLNVNCPTVSYADLDFEMLYLEQNVQHDEVNGLLTVGKLSFADSTSFHELKLTNTGAHGIQDAILSWDPNTDDYSALTWRTTILPNDYISFALQP